MKKIKKDNEKLKKEKKNNNKKLLIVSAISIFTILGGTLAYFTTSSNIKNIINTALYQNKIVEEFVSPDNWTPGDTTSKTIKVTNTGRIDMAVRVSYEEKWINANGDELPLKDSSNNVAAIINFNDGWEKNSDGYYYYGSKENMRRLTPNETTSSFISGITFNKNVSATLEENISEDGQTISYVSTGNGYDNAKYTLTVKVETIQFDHNDIW